MHINEQVNAARDTIDGDAVWDVLKDAERIVVARGLKTVSFDPSRDREEILEKARGRTGNLRAPTVKIGGTFYVGFNKEMYRDEIV